MISGIYGGTTRENVARAALEGIAWRVADVVAAIKETAPVETLRVDGGLTNEPLLLQLQADMIGAPVEAAGADATVLGAAALAGVGAGVIGSLTDLPEMLPADRRVEPEQDEEWRIDGARALARIRPGDRGARPALARIARPKLESR